MQSSAPAHAKYAIRTGRVLDRAPAILEFSRLGSSKPPPLPVIEEVAPEDLVDDTEEMATPAPPVIAKIVRTTHVESPPPIAKPKRRVARSRGPSVVSMIATVVVLAAIGALAGFGMRSLARPPMVGASAAISGGAAGAVGDREQRDPRAARVTSAPAPVLPVLAAPPAPESTAPKSVAAPPRVTKAQGNARAAHAAHVQNRPAAAPAAPRGTKKRATH